MPTINFELNEPRNSETKTNNNNVAKKKKKKKKDIFRKRKGLGPS